MRLLRSGVPANGPIFKWRNSTELGEVIAANWLELTTSCLRHRWPAGLSRRFNLPKRFDVDADNCERKAGMASLDRLVQPLWEFTLPGHGAVPLAVIVGDAAYLPKPQFLVDWCERCFGQSARFDQLIELRSPRCRQPPRGLGDYFGKQFGCCFLCKAYVPCKCRQLL